MYYSANDWHRKQWRWQAGTFTVGAHDEDDFLCATPPSATDEYTQLDGQRFSDPQDSQGRPRTSDAAVAADESRRSRESR